MGTDLMALPSSTLFDEQFQVLCPGGRPLKNLPLTVTDGKQSLRHRISSDGSHPRIHTFTATPLTAMLEWDELLPSSERKNHGDA
jgi:hypothetical protein